jgi:DNA-binding NtrC family response regulator
MRENSTPTVRKSHRVSPFGSIPFPHRILVADDDPDIRSLNVKALTHLGYHVDAVEDGATAWDALQRKSHDLLLTDNNMPKVSGIELLKKMHAANIKMPVILATGVLPAEEFPWIKPSATLLKPYSIDALLGMVSEVLTSLVRVPAKISTGETYPGVFLI